MHVPEKIKPIIQYLSLPKAVGWFVINYHTHNKTLISHQNHHHHTTIIKKPLNKGHGRKREEQEEQEAKTPTPK